MQRLGRGPSRSRHHSTATTVGSLALACALAGCGDDPSSIAERFRQTAYTLPPELTNPLERPANQISVVHDQCGEDFHYMHLGHPNVAVNQTFSVAGNRCEVAETKSVWFNGAWHACYRCKRTADNIFNNLMGVSGGTNVQIYPVEDPGCHQRPDNGVSVGGTSIFSDIISTIGINTNGCATDPLSLDEAPGYIGETDSSGVLNDGADRSTFGFFITFEQGGQTVEYFVLFSYDRLGDLCAFEMFMWGPITRDANGDLTGTPPLILGAAIDGNGELLNEVPLELASASNFNPLDGDPPEGRPVQVGVHLPDQGCLECHGGNGADETFPFPWETTVTDLNSGCEDDTDGSSDGSSDGTGGTTGYGDSSTGYGTGGTTGYGDSSTGYYGTYGSTSYGTYGSTSYGSTSYGSTSYGTYGSTSYGSTSYGSTSYGSTSYGTYGSTSYGSTSW